MKICPKCGAEGDGVFCVSCGAAMASADSAAPAPAVEKPMGTPAEQPAYTAPQPTYTAPQPTYTAPQQPYGGYYAPQAPAEQPVSVGGWIGRSLIPYIPFVGGLIYLIMLFVWMGDKTKEATFRNWAKAQLVVMGIIVGLAILLAILMTVLGVTVAEMM